MKKKGKKTFRPCKMPRFLVGSVSPQVIKTDLAEYNSHRYKVFSAKPRVDTSPPEMNPYNYINVRKIRGDAERMQIIDMENKQIVKTITIINRTIGRIDSYNPEAYACKSRWNAHILRMKKIEQKNKAIHHKIISAKPSADVVLAQQASISCGLDKLSQRPMCFLEFQVVGGPFLGRIEIELYHDHVPVTAQNFLAICSGENKNRLTYKNCPVHRIVPGRFLESGDITLGTGRGGTSIYGKDFAEEGHQLRHTKAGVISMVRVRKHNNNSRFCITFANMESIDRQNVVFGYITKGADNLFKIEGYGRRIGKPLMPIIISNCGKLNTPAP